MSSSHQELRFKEEEDCADIEDNVSQPPDPLNKKENPRPWDNLESTEFTDFEPAPQTQKKEKDELPEKVKLDSYYFNKAEQTRIIRALAMYYMYKSFRSKGLDSYLDLNFEKSQGQNIVEIQEKVTDRAEFDVLREFMENRVLNTRFKRGRFPNSDDPLTDESEDNDQPKEKTIEEEEEIPEPPDNFQKDPDWKA